MNKIIRWRESVFDGDSNEEMPSNMMQSFSFVGSLPVNEIRSMRFLIGNTNFPICHVDCGFICAVDGIETFEVFSQYRFRIGIGECFDINQVKKSVEDLFTGNNLFLNDDLNSKINMAKEVCSRYPYWIIYVLPNEKIVSVFKNEASEVIGFKKLFHQTCEKVGGIIYEQ